MDSNRIIEILQGTAYPESLSVKQALLKVWNECAQEHNADLAKMRRTDVSNNAEFKIWDDLFGILAWKFQPTKSGDMYLDGEAVYNELKDKFYLRRK